MGGGTDAGTGATWSFTVSRGALSLRNKDGVKKGVACAMPLSHPMVDGKMGLESCCRKACEVKCSVVSCRVFVVGGEGLWHKNSGISPDVHHSCQAVCLERYSLTTYSPPWTTVSIAKKGIAGHE